MIVILEEELAGPNEQIMKIKKSGSRMFTSLVDAEDDTIKKETGHISEDFFSHVNLSFSCRKTLIKNKNI